MVSLVYLAAVIRTKIYFVSLGDAKKRGVDEKKEKGMLNVLQLFVNCILILI